MITTQWPSLTLTFQDLAFICPTYTSIWTEDIFNGHLGGVILATLAQFVHKPRTQVPVQPVLTPGGCFLTLGDRPALSVWKVFPLPLSHSLPGGEILILVPNEVVLFYCPGEVLFAWPRFKEFLSNSCWETGSRLYSLRVTKWLPPAKQTMA